MLHDHGNRPVSTIASCEGFSSYPRIQSRKTESAHLHPRSARSLLIAPLAPLSMWRIRVRLRRRQVRPSPITLGNLRANVGGGCLWTTRPVNEAYDEQRGARTSRKGYSTMEHVLLTGYPGFLAENLIRRCREAHSDVFWHLLVLPEELPRAAARLRSLGLTGSHFTLHPGDITRPDLALASDDAQSLKGRIERCFHLAALYDLTAPAMASDLANVVGTRRVVEFVGQCTRLRKFNYVSTCYVSGTLQGDIQEDALREPPGFRNEYERTKYAAEKIVRDRMGSIPTTIFRPSVVVGDSQTGQTDKFDGPYVLIDFFKRTHRWLPRIPNLGLNNTYFNSVPVDFVTTVMRDVGFSDECLGQTLHVADPTPPTTAHSFAAFYRQVTRRAPLTVSDPIKRRALRALHVFPLDLITGIPAKSVEYFQHEGRYQTDNLQAACRRLNITLPTWQEFYRPVVRFATKENRHAPNSAVIGQFRRWCSVFRLLYAVTAIGFLFAPGLVIRLLTPFDRPDAAGHLLSDNLLWRPLAVSLLAALFVAVTSLERNPFIKPLHILVIVCKIVSTALFIAAAIRTAAVSLVMAAIIDGLIAVFHVLFYRRLCRVRPMLGDEFKWDLYHLLFPSRFIVRFTETMLPNLDEPVDIRAVAESVRDDVRRLPFTARWAFIVCAYFVAILLPCFFGFPPFLMMSMNSCRRFLRRAHHSSFSVFKLPLMFMKLLCSNHLFTQEPYLRSIGAV